VLQPVVVVYSEVELQEVVEDYSVQARHNKGVDSAELNNKANSANPNNQQEGSSVHLELKREPGASGLQPEDLEPERLRRPLVEAEVYSAPQVRSEGNKQEQQVECLVTQLNHNNKAEVYLAEHPLLNPIPLANLPEQVEVCSDQQTRSALDHLQQVVSEHQQVAVAACSEEEEHLKLLPAGSHSVVSKPALQERSELQRLQHLVKRNNQLAALSAVVVDLEPDSSKQEEVCLAEVHNKWEDLVNSKEGLVNRAALCPIGNQLTNVLTGKSRLCIINQSLSWGSSIKASKINQLNNSDGKI